MQELQEKCYHPLCSETHPYRNKITLWGHSPPILKFDFVKYRDFGMKLSLKVTLRKLRLGCGFL